MERDKTITRVIIQQPSLPGYRIPLFQRLAAQQGIELCVYYSDSNKTLENAEPEGLDTHCVPMWVKNIGRRKVKWHGAQWNGAKKGSCDVLVLSWDAQYLSLIPALLRARFNRIKTILWGHGYSKCESPVRKTIRDTIGRLADGLLFYDANTARSFLSAGWSKERIYTAPNSLDQADIQCARQWWQDRPEQLKAFQTEHGLRGGKNIIYIGRIYEENRLDILIQALQKVKHKLPDVQLLVIGNVNETARELQQLAVAHGVTDCIRWLGPVYAEERIAPFMLSSQLFCYPANIGLSIMHAMGYGLPVVTGDHIASHNPEIHVLCNGENGCLYRHLDVDDLEAKLSSLLNFPGKTLEMGSCARESVLRDFTIQKMADGFLEAIRSVVQD